MLNNRGEGTGVPFTWNSFLFFLHPRAEVVFLLHHGTSFGKIIKSIFSMAKKKLLSDKEYTEIPKCTSPHLLCILCLDFGLTRFQIAFTAPIEDKKKEGKNGL